MIDKALKYKKEIYSELERVYKDPSYTWFFVENFSTIDGVMQELDNSLISINEKTNKVNFLLILNPVPNGLFLHTISFGTSIDWVSEFSKYFFQHREDYSKYKYFYLKYCKENVKVFKRNETFFGRIPGSLRIKWKSITNPSGETSECFIYRTLISEYEKFLKKLRLI